MEEIETIKKELKGILSIKRYQHSIGVMEKAEEFAKIYNIDTKKAALAGLTHDIAKEMSNKEMLEYVLQNDIKVDSIEMESPSLLHGPIGADICKKKYAFSEDMARAIAIHTTGDENMSIFDKIIFISDKIEKNRVYDCVQDIREVSVINLDEALLLFLNHHIERMIKKGKIIHPKSILFRNSIIKSEE